MKERNWKCWPFVATLGWWSFLCSFSTGRALTGLHGLTVPCWAEMPRPWVRSGTLGGPMGQHYLLQLQNRALPSCNHWWHTPSTFPDRFSCHSSCECGKRHRKNNRSCSQAQGMWPLQTQHTQKKVKRRAALLLRASESGKWGYVLRECPTFLNTTTDSTISCHSKPLCLLWITWQGARICLALTYFYSHVLSPLYHYFMDSPVGFYLVLYTQM